MSRYRKVDTRIWNDEKFICFDDDGKLAFVFVLTHPHLTALGAMRGTLAGLAAELGWSPKRFRDATAPAIRAGMVQVNDTTAYIGLPNFLKYNQAENPNVVKGAWLEALSQIPECPEKRALILRCRKYLDGQTQRFKDQVAEAVWEAFSKAMPEGLPEALRDPSPQPSPKPEPEPEPEPEQLPPPPSPSQSEWGRTGAVNGWGTPEALVELYNSSIPPGHPQVTKLTAGRRKKARDYLAQFPDQEFWARAVAEIARSRFLRGLRPSPGHENFRADLDWLLAKGKDGTENAVKVAEGKYRDTTTVPEDDDDDAG